mgnify:FL=1
MDDHSVSEQDRELDTLLSEVKGLLGEEQAAPSDAPEGVDAPQQTDEASAPMTAGDVSIDFEKFYDDASSFADEGIYTPPTAYEQSKSAYQVARRAENDRAREAERQKRDLQRQARDKEEERVMRKLESRNKKTAETVKNPPRSDEEYAKWLYEQGVEPETEEHRELLRRRELEQQPAKKPKKKRTGGFPKAVLAIVLVLAALLSGVHFLLAKQPEAETGLGARKAGCATILIAGTDEGGYRTDTMMLFSVDRASGTMSLVSIPRDTLIYCEYAVPKINSAYGWASGGEAGMQELLKRVTEIIGFAPDGYVLVDLSCFEALVDTMGGVTFDVPVDMHYTDPSQGLTIDISAGEQHLNGEQAMQVVRFRSGYAMQDLGRVETQRSFLSAAIHQWTGLKGLIHLPAALKLILNASQTDLSARELVWLCESALLCSRGEIRTQTLPGEPSYIAGGSYYVLDAAGVCQTVNACCNPYEQAVAVSNLYIRVG